MSFAVAGQQAQLVTVVLLAQNMASGAATQAGQSVQAHAERLRSAALLSAQSQESQGAGVRVMFASSASGQAQSGSGAMSRHIYVTAISHQAQRVVFSTQRERSGSTASAQASAALGLMIKTVFFNLSSAQAQLGALVQTQRHVSANQISTQTQRLLGVGVRTRSFAGSGAQGQSAEGYTGRTVYGSEADGIAQSTIALMTRLRLGSMASAGAQSSAGASSLQVPVGCQSAQASSGQAAFMREIHALAQGKQSQAGGGQLQRSRALSVQSKQVQELLLQTICYLYTPSVYIAYVSPQVFGVVVPAQEMQAGIGEALTTATLDPASATAALAFTGGGAMVGVAVTDATVEAQDTSATVLI